MIVRYDAVGMSDKCTKDDNEDAFYLDNKKGVFIVADGASGRDHGETASRIAVDTSSKFLLPHEFFAMSLEDTAHAVRDSMTAARESVENYFISKGYERSSENFPCTTLSIAVTNGDYLVHGNIGDSRLYLVHPEGRQNDAPKGFSFGVTLENVTSHEHRFIGMGSHRPSMRTFKLRPDYCGFLLCTDGFYHHFEDDIVISDVRFDKSITGIRDFFVKYSRGRPRLSDENFPKVFGTVSVGEEKVGEENDFFNYERSPDDVVNIVKRLCQLDALDNVTFIYCLLKR